MILVTGGAGFIGLNIIKALNKIGRDDIIIVDHINNIKYMNLSDLKFSFYLDRKDFYKDIKSLPYIDLIIHQGACSDTTQTNYEYIIDVNYNYSRILFDYAVQNMIPFIYASSASVYGLNKDTEEILKNERPINLYSFSKLLFDRYVNYHLTSRKLKSNIVGLRYFNVYGPGEDHKGRMASVPNHFYKQYKHDRVLRLFEGSDNFKRDFIYIDDVVNIVMSFVIQNSVQGIFNCGTGTTRSFFELAQICESLINSDKNVCRIHTTPFPKDLIGKYQTYTCSNNKKLKDVIGDYKFITLEDGITEYYKRMDCQNA